MRLRFVSSRLQVRSPAESYQLARDVISLTVVHLVGPWGPQIVLYMCLYRTYNHAYIKN